MAGKIASETFAAVCSMVSLRLSSELSRRVAHCIICLRIREGTEGVVSTLSMPHLLQRTPLSGLVSVKSEHGQEPAHGQRSQ